MSPGGFSLRLLVPVFLRRRSKKYEKLETEDHEKKKQEATLDELVRINFKIVSQPILLLGMQFISKLGDPERCPFDLFFFSLIELSLLWQGSCFGIF